MCGISGSFSKEKLIELCTANEYRGSRSHSLAYYDIEERDFFAIQKNNGPVDYNFKIPANHYTIIHQQAPTDEDNGIHPATINGSYLWHNGLLKAKTVEALQKLYKLDTTWDTFLLLRFLQDHLVPAGIDGSFSCVFYDKVNLFLFRNELAPLFYDSNGNISSTKFKNSQSLEPNKMFIFDPSKVTFKSILQFDTVENPWVI